MQFMAGGCNSEIRVLAKHVQGSWSDPQDHKIEQQNKTKQPPNTHKNKP